MRLAFRIFPVQWVGNLVVMVLLAAWLQIPDSHSWQLALSLVSGALLVVVFLGLFIYTFRIVRRCGTPPARWRSAVVLIVLLGAWCVLLFPIAAGRAHEGLFAGYWNSQSTPWLRHRLGYSQMVAWQERVYDCVQWVWAAVLLPFAVEFSSCGVTRGSLGSAARAFRFWVYWACAIGFGFVGSAVTWGLAGWAPGGTLVGQTLSVLGRLGIAYSVDVLLWCILLGVLAKCLDERDGGVGSG